VELANLGDWVVGTGGASLRSSGHGTLVYAMKVTEKLTLQQYYDDKRFRARADNDPKDTARTNRFALISNDFFYFGANAVSIPPALKRLEKKGPGFRDKFDESFITQFDDWLRRSFRAGKHGEPCGGPPADASRSAKTSKCRPQTQRKGICRGEAK
jgi:hypothetical protein